MELLIDTLNNISYEVIETDDEEYVKLRHDEDSILGLCDNAKQKIYLHKNLSYQIKKKTLKHELMHALLYEYCADRISYDDEQICDLMATYSSTVERLASQYFSAMGTVTTISSYPNNVSSSLHYDNKNQNVTLR